MNKRESLFWLFVVLVFLFFSFSDVLGQNVAGAGTGLEGDAEKILNATEKLQRFHENLTGFGEEEKWEYLGRQWKELLLKNKLISSVDGFFRKINFVFVVLFSRYYGFSMELFFVFLMWIFTFISLPKYFVWLKVGWQKLLAGFAGTLILAHIQVFNYLASGAFKLIFYKKSGVWVTIIYIVIFFAIIFYYFLNRYFAGMLKKSQEKKEKEELEFKVKKSEERMGKMRKGIG